MTTRVTYLMYNLCNVMSQHDNIESIIIQGDSYYAKVGSELYWLENVGHEDLAYKEFSAPNNSKQLI